MRGLRGETKSRSWERRCLRIVVQRIRPRLLGRLSTVRKWKCDSNRRIGMGVPLLEGHHEALLLYHQYNFQGVKWDLVVWAVRGGRGPVFCACECVVRRTEGQEGRLDFAAARRRVSDSPSPSPFSAVQGQCSCTSVSRDSHTVQIAETSFPQHHSQQPLDSPSVVHTLVPG